MTFMFVMYVCVSVSIMAKGLLGKRTLHEGMWDRGNSTIKALSFAIYIKL